MSFNLSTASGWYIEVKSVNGADAVSATARLKNSDEVVSVIGLSSEDLKMYLIRAGVTANDQEWESFNSQLKNML